MEMCPTRPADTYTLHVTQAVSPRLLLLVLEFLIADMIIPGGDFERAKIDKPRSMTMFHSSVAINGLQPLAS
jgi:hypothetical protein